MIYKSEKESKAFGYNIGRGDDECLKDLTVLKSEIKTQKIDILKLTLKKTDQDLYNQLNLLNYPYYLLGIVIVYKSNFRINDVKLYSHENLNFVEYLGEDPIVFKNLVREIFKDSPSSFFSNPELKNLTSKEKQLDCLVEYISTLNSSIDEQHYTHLMYVDGHLAGFITSHKENDGGAATYAGILKQFQGKGLYMDLINFIQNYGKEIGQKWGTASVQLQNSVVQKAFVKAGLSLSGYELNIHVNCFEGKLKTK